MAQRKNLSKKDNEADWVPGDYGYVINTKWDGTNELRRGENLIYLGGEQFWGHNDGNRVRSLPRWKEAVARWNGGSELDKWKKFPKIGLQED